jgi:hypothetical protein
MKQNDRISNTVTIGCYKIYNICNHEEIPQIF